LFSDPVVNWYESSFWASWMLLMVNTRMIESRVEALQMTLANGLQLLEGFEERLDARLT